MALSLAFVLLGGWNPSVDELPTSAGKYHPQGRAACALAASQAMQLEDVLLLPTLMRAVGGLRNPGVFVELGALDGKRFSNTWMLERCFSWRGLLIEANPINFAKLNASGRTACAEGRCVHSAVCREGVGSVRISLEGGETAGELRFLTKKRQKSRAKRVADVPCEPLSSLMARHGLASEADFLSLDVAGQGTHSAPLSRAAGPVQAVLRPCSPVVGLS